MKSLIVAICAVTMLANCNKGVESQFTPFVVKVDSIAHTSFAASNDTIVVRFFGTIGNDGCHSFSHFETARQALQLDVTVWGQRQEASACPAVMVYLEGREYKFVPAQMGWLKIIVHQPDGSAIKDSIIVK
jgi:hypothetical protein